MSNKQLKVSPSERIDTSDFLYGGNGYTDAVTTTFNQSVLAVKRAHSLGSSFRIEILDQTSFPGLINVYNGKYFAKDGFLVSNEEQTTAIDSVTLTGSNQTFYVELVASSSVSDVDDRAFWDNTFDNGTGNPAGKEYVDSVATRVSTIWTIVTPVSTSGFDVTSNPNSIKFPLAIISTDSTGKITTAVNPGLTTVSASTVLEIASSVSDVKLKVADSTILGDSGSTILVGVSDGLTETRTVTNNDRINGIITISSGLTNPHVAGAIVRATGSDTRQFIRERTSQTIEETGASSTHPDKSRHLYSGNEARGVALLSSKETFLARDDTQLKTLKDQIDALTALVKEMKVGSTAPFPVSFSSTRYYDFVGSIQGSKTASFTIGNGTTSIGDFNGTDHTPFQAAINQALSLGNSEVVLYIKHGSYTFTNTVTAGLNVSIIGESVNGQQVAISGGTLTAANFSITGTLNLSTISLFRPTASTTGAIVLNGAGSTLYANKVQTGSLLSPLVTSSSTIRIYTKDCILTAVGTVTGMIGATVIGGAIETTVIALGGTSTSFFGQSITNTECYGCTVNISGNGSFITADVNISNSYIDSCRFNISGTLSTASVVRMGSSSTTCNISVTNSSVFYADAADGAVSFYIKNNIGCNFSDNSIIIAFNASATGAGIAGIFVDGSGSDVADGLKIDNNRIILTAGKSGNCIFINNCRTESVHITGCSLSGGSTGVQFASIQNSLPSNEGRSSVNVADNTYTGGNYDIGSTFTSLQYGILLNGIPNIFDLNIINNNILGIRAASTAGISVKNQAAVGLTTTRSKINIQGNGLKRIGRPTSDETPVSIGIEVTGMNQYTVVRVTGNQIDTLCGITVEGIGIGSGHAATLVTENSIENLGGYSSTTATVTGIEALSVSNGIISDNIVFSLFTSGSSAAVVKGLNIASNYFTVTGNQINTLSQVGTGTPTGIYAVNCGAFSCVGNSISGIAGFGIYKFVSNDTKYSIKIDGNTITGVYDPIFVNTDAAFTTTSIIKGLSIVGNILSIVSHTGIKILNNGSTPINISGVNVSNNSITEFPGIPNNPHASIYVFQCSNSSITGNSCVGDIGTTSTTSSFRTSIYAEQCLIMSITGNSCHWFVPSSATVVTQGNMYIKGSFDFMISGNVILGANTASVGKTVIIDAGQGGYITGNVMITDGTGSSSTQISQINSPVNVSELLIGAAQLNLTA